MSSNSKNSKVRLSLWSRIAPRYGNLGYWQALVLVVAFGLRVGNQLLLSLLPTAKTAESAARMENVTPMRRADSMTCRCRFTFKLYCEPMVPRDLAR